MPNPTRRSRPLAAVAVAVLAAVSLSACGSDDSGEDPFAEGGKGGGTVVVGSANFPENELLMQMYAQALEAEDVTVETRPNIGAREIYMEAFESGDIDLLPEYNGALLAYLSGDAGVPDDLTSPDEVYDALQDKLPEGSETLPQSAAEDKDTLTVTKETAEQYDLQAIPDLKPVAGELVVGAGPEFRERFQGLVGLKEVYGVDFKEFKPLDPGGPLTVGALKDGDVDVANIFSTDSAIRVNDWVVLEDPEDLYLSQNVVPLIRSDKVTPEAKEALDGVNKALTTENLTEELARVQVDKEDPVTVAKDFLEKNDLL